MSPLIQSQRSLLAPSWAGYPNALWRRAKAIPSLDLRFADNKSLVDATTGQNLVTFTRASSGTYVDSQGVIRTATTNLLLRSEEFNDAVWGKVGGSLTANAIAAPDGQTTADLFTEDTGTGQHDVRVTSPTLADATTYTFSVYARTNGRQLQIIYPLNTSGHGAVFNLSNGTFTLVGNTVSASIALVGNGWYRCTCTGTKAGGSGTSNIRLLTNNGTTNNYTGDGTSGFYLWGAQLEQSSTVGEYTPTTSTINSAPRFDHNPTTGESLGLLVEESRTNIFLQSNGFDTTWTNTLSSETAASGIAPDGINAAWELKDTVDAVASNHIIAQGNVPFTSGVAYTMSVFAKAGTLSSIALVFPAAMVGTAIIAVKANLSTGAIIATGSGATASVTQYPNGWYRISATMTATATSTGSFQIRTAPLSGGGTSYQGDGNGTILIWGAQFEAGAFPTSYIPTTTAAVTRSADVASITGSNFSSWYRQDEGTVFISARTNATHGGVNSFPRKLSISDGTNNNSIEDYYRVLSSYTDAGYRVDVAGVNQVSYDTNDQRNGQSSVVGYSVNNFALAVGGTVVNTDSSGTIPTTTLLRLGQRGDGSAILNGTIRRLTYFPTRLPNSTLQGITQQ